MADPIAEAVLKAYRGVGRLLRPGLGLYLSARARRGKEDDARRGERFGRASLERPDGPIVWIHAASVGETISVLPLIERLVAEGPTVLLTTGTVTSAAIAAQRLPARALHQFVPLDVDAFVSRFLDHWRPSIALFVESEIWPATVLTLADRAIPQVLINGRMSARSSRRWTRLAGLARSLFGRLSLCLAQSEPDGQRFRALGAAPVIVTGNLKFEGDAPGFDPAELERLQAQIGGRPVWLAASTHPGEEAIVGAVHRALVATQPDLLTLLAPRHPPRGPEIRQALAGAGLAVAARSAGEPITRETAVYLADTIGEMGLFYRLSKLAFLGGSLAKRGGQNPLEPARLDTAILHGPNIANFLDIYGALDAVGGAEVVADADALAAAVGRLLADPRQSAEIAAKARLMVEAGAGALERTLDACAPYLTPLAAPAHATLAGAAP